MDTLIDNYREGIFQFNPEFSDANAEKPLALGLSSLISLKEDFEMFGFQITIVLSLPDCDVLRYGFVLSVRIPGWIPLTSADVKSMGNTERIPQKIKELLFSRASEQIKDACIYVLSFANGAISAKLASNNPAPTLLGDIDVNEFISNITFRLIPGK